MKNNETDGGKFTERGRGVGTIDEGMVRKRAQELAVIAGRSENHLIEADLEQARRELSGEEGLNPTPTAGEQLTEEERWQEVPTDMGRKAPTLSAADEQTVAQRLVEEGVEEAEQDQMVRSERLMRQREKKS